MDGVFNSLIIIALENSYAYLIYKYILISFNIKKMNKKLN